jgi:hypothetical protein
MRAQTSLTLILPMDKGNSLINMPKKALALLDAHQSPTSSWSDTEQRREDIRRGVLRVLKESR